MLTPFQRQVAQLIGQALQPFGFALGGGQALQAHKIVDRLSRDLDNYSESLDPQIYENAEHAVVTSMTGHGYTTAVMLRDSWFRQIIVTDPATNEEVGIDLGYDFRKNPPVFITGIGPVLDIHDVVTGKVCARSSTGEPSATTSISTPSWGLADGRSSPCWRSFARSAQNCRQLISLTSCRRPTRAMLRNMRRWA